MSCLVAIIERFSARNEGGELSRDEEGRVRWGKRAAGLLIRRADGRILLVLRSADVLDPLTWGIPGGRVEPGENEWEGAVSEAQEELGGLPPLQKTGETVYRSGSFQYVTFLVDVEDEAAEEWVPSLNWENDDWGWFDLDNLPSPLHPGVNFAIRNLL